MSTEPVASTSATPRLSLWICVAISLMTLAVYSPTLFQGSDFINADDPDYVTSNPHVKQGLSWSGARWALFSFDVGMWHPLTWISLQADVQMFGLDARGFHLVNVVLHMVNALILFGLLKSMTGAVWRSAAVAVFFAIHPGHVESVAWVTERKDVLSALFWLLAIAAYAWYARRPSIVRYLAIMAALVLGLLAKPMAVTLPAVLLLLDYWPLRRWRIGGANIATSYQPASLGRLIAEKLPLFLLIVAVIPLTMRAQAPVVRTLEEFPISVRISNALISYIAYIRMLVWPTDLALFYPHPRKWLLVPSIISAVLLLMGTATSAVLWRRRPYVLVGWLWYLGTLVPVIQLVQIGMMARADRYTYIPWIGLFILGAWGAADLAERWKSSRQPIRFLTGAAIVACLVLTWKQVGYWKNSETLWRHALDVTENSWVAHEYLGGALAANGKLVEARAELRKALQIVPESTSAHFRLGNVLEQLGDFPGAARHFALSLRSNPNQSVARVRLGNVLEKLGRTDEAMQQLTRALDLDPEDVDARIGIARVLEGRGDWEGARRQYEIVLQSQPQSAPLRIQLGVVLARLGQTEAALEQYNLAVKLNPKLDEAYNNKAVLLERLGRWNDAILAYRNAVELSPNDFRYRCNLAFALFESDQRKPAMDQYAEAFRIQGDWPGVALAEAWSKSTNTDPALRNGAQAVRLARMVCQATEFRMPQAMDVLAAAYAEQGKFAEAIRYEQQAIDGATGNTPAEIMAALRERLKNYENGQPFREKPTP